MVNGRPQPLDRPEFVRDVESIARIDAVRQATLLVIIAAIWQVMLSSDRMS